MSGEIIQDDMPISFEQASKNEYSEKARKVRQKLLEATNSKTVAEFLVKLVYGEDFHMPARLLDTQIEATGSMVLELADAVEKIEMYNNFFGKELAEAIRYLHNEGVLMRVSFGRESSPVVYMNAPYWTHQASNCTDGEQRKYTDEERTEMYRKILSTLRQFDPDELDLTEPHGIRAWWD